MNDLSTSIIRIVILDKRTLIRSGLRCIIENQANLKVVGQAGNLNEALSQIASTRPDIILFEFDQEGGLSNTDLPDIIKACSKSRLILVTGSNDRQTYLQAVQQGALGIVLITQPSEVLIKAINKVHLGEMWVEHSLITHLMTTAFHTQSESVKDPELEKIELLSAREHEVIKFIGRGLKNKHIANQLNISETTVRHYLTSIYNKLDVTDRLELLIFAHRHNLTQFLP